MARPPVVALEVGTSKTVAVVAELREDDGYVMITGLGEQPSAGVRKGEVISLPHTTACVRAALASAEDSAHVTIREVHLAVSGGHIQGLVNRGVVPVMDSEGGITQTEVDKVMDVARAVSLPPDRDLLHTICQHFCVDDQERVVRPDGMTGAKLALDMLVLHGVRTQLTNAIRAVSGVPVEVHDVAFSGLCSALAVLTAEQKRSGAVVIDLGGGTTDYVAYVEGMLMTAGAFGVGGEHVTNDIALGFNIPLSQAERCKRESGAAVCARGKSKQRVALPPDAGFPGRTVSLKSLHTVMNARLDEIFRLVKARLEELDILRRVGMGVVLTGGGAHTPEICELAQQVFGLPAAAGKPLNVSGLATATEGPQYATCVGLAQYAFKMMTDGPRRPGPLRGILDRLFGR